MSLVCINYQAYSLTTERLVELQKTWLSLKEFENVLNDAHKNLIQINKDQLNIGDIGEYIKKLRKN